MKNLSLKNQILALGLGSILVVSVVAMIAFMVFKNELDAYDTLFSEEVATAVEVGETNLAFKRQVQEWKNVLLRGHDPQEMAKYWGRFAEHQESIQSNTQKLLDSRIPPAAAEKIRRFQTLHREAFSKYEQGRRAFIESGYDPKVGDQAVRGIDREPTKALEEAGDIIVQEAYAQNAALVSEGKAVTTWSSLALLVVFVLVALVAGLIGSRRIAGPVSELLGYIRNLSEGQFNNQITLRSDDEIGQVADAVRNLQTKLRDSTSNLREVVAELNASGDKMHEVSGRIQEGTHNQYSRTEHSASAMTELSSTAKEVAEHAAEAKSASDEAEEAAVAGEGVMNGAIGTMSEMKHQIENTAEVINQLEANTSEVGKVLDVIRGIAEQTNLLALNAAIEAARAGEQGRGFAVVADEVRTLAQRTQESTAEIHDMIVNVQTGAHSAVEAIQTGARQSADTMERLNDAGEHLKIIRQSIDRITGVNQLIASAAHEQAHVSEDISESISQIASIAGDSAQQAAEVNTLAEAMQSIGNSLKAIVADLNKS